MKFLFSLIFLIQCNFLFAQVSVKINFVANNEPLILDSLCYENALNQKFMITKCQFFLSDIITDIFSLEDCHFFDVRDSSSYVWKLDDKHKKIKDLIFTFGIDKTKHESLKLKNPIHSLMFWPKVLGSGYHYCKIEIKFLDKDNLLSNFNCHLGPGVNPKQFSFSNLISKKEVIINFDICKFLCNNSLYDFSTNPGIMDKPQIMQIFIDNLDGCFTIK